MLDVWSEKTCFNGATPFQTWKYLFHDGKLRLVPGASMGPRLFRRGNVVALVEDLEGKIGKVASMGPRLFRRGNSEVWPWRNRARDSFNGATPFQTWKSLTPSIRRARPSASMGPRLFRRGNFCHKAVSLQTARSFNGATPFQTWKWVCLP